MKEDQEGLPFCFYKQEQMEEMKKELIDTEV